MIFPKDFPDKLRSSILVSEVVGKKVKLKSNGKEFGGLCPFHNEKTPSFTVNDQKGFYHCFGCSAHGDIISFVMNNEGLEYKEAVIRLAEDFSIPIPKVHFDEVKENQLERSFLLLETICSFFEKNLALDKQHEALSYLRKRGIDNKIIKKFRLGFAPNSYDDLVNFLQHEGFREDEIIKSGIIGKNEKGKLYSKFRNRVIFPITNKQNKVIAFGGRTIADDLPKYLNSAETDFFKKNQTLYNYFFARKAIFDKSYAVVVEGYMDTISLSANGLENVVAGLGTALSAEHLKELFVITDKIVICLDGDSAGIRAAKRVSEIALPLITSKKNIAFTFLPNQLDPDDFIKEFGANELEKTFINSSSLSESLFEFALMELKVDKNKINAETKAKIESNLLAKSELIKDVTTKKHFIFFFKDLLFNLGKKSQKNKDNLESVTSFIKKYQKPANKTADILAKSIIALIIKFPELANFRDNDFDIREVNFFSEEFSNVKELLLEEIDVNNLKDEVLIEAISDKISKKDSSDLKNLLASISFITLESAQIKFSILLLKDLLLQVEQQYREVLNKIDEIETHQTAITNQKIKEIFDYKNSLERRILVLEKETI